MVKNKGEKALFKTDVYKGKKEDYVKTLKYLAELAEDEKWSFSRDEKKPFRILENYIEFTYNRLEEENKMLVSSEGKKMCMNTGLLTKYRQEIVALFTKYSGSYLPNCKWCFVGFYKSSDRIITDEFDRIPEIADYTSDTTDLIYDRHLRIVCQKEHIIDDNFQRFLEAGYNDQSLINALLDNAIKTIELKLQRNYKLALPFYYHNTETGEKKIQLLAPLYMAGAPVKLALVLDRKENHYEAITVLPVTWAYMNARVIVRPEEEWAKIVDEADEPIAEAFKDSIDNQ